jgi:hypothetical protein
VDSTHVEQEDKPIPRMRQEAMGVFFALMNSGPLKYQLAKCDKCADHYFRGKLRTKEPYTGTFFCAECRKKGATANRAKQDRRRRAHEDMVKEAALALQRWPGLPEKARASYGTEKLYIARMLARRGISVKWVTRNWQAVQQYQPEQGMVV